MSDTVEATPEIVPADGHALTDKQADILLHMTGLDSSEEAYRSHFVAGKGHEDLPTLAELEVGGLVALARTPGFCDPADIVYITTPAGISAAQRARIARKPKLTRSQERYRKWIEISDTYDGGFRAWLKAGCPGFDRPWPPREPSWWEELAQ